MSGASSADAAEHAAGTMPVIFFGHGSPMIALQTNAVTET